MIPNNKLVGIFCFLLILTGGAVFADSPGEHGLVLTCAVSTNQPQLAPETPVWLDLVVTNARNTVFNGVFCLLDDSGAFATTSDMTDSLRERCIDRMIEDAPGQTLVLKPGEQKVFRILLNDLVPVTKPGKLSGWVVLPLLEDERPPDSRFTLVAPFRLTLGNPLTPIQLIAAEKSTLAALGSLSDATRSDAIKSLAALPDANANLLLDEATKASQSHAWAGDLVYALGQRPRTADNIKALTDIVQLGDSTLSPLATKYLKDGQ